MYRNQSKERASHAPYDADYLIERTLRLLMSLTHPRVQALMALQGFDEKERQEGWRLFDLATGRHLELDERQRPGSAPAKKLVRLVDDPPPMAPEPDAATEEERLRAIDEMWAWTKDWSKTARTVVRNRNLRLHMGISRVKRGPGAGGGNGGGEGEGE